MVQKTVRKYETSQFPTARGDIIEFPVSPKPQISHLILRFKATNYHIWHL